MKKRFYSITRDLHLYPGLFISPYVLVFSVSVFFLVHSWVPGEHTDRPRRVVAGLSLPADFESLDTRARVDALRSVLPAMGVSGEIGFVRHIPQQGLVVFPVAVPGRETMVEMDLKTSIAVLTQHESGVWDGLAALHKWPGPHNANIRMNWFPIRVWCWLADATVYLLFFISASGLYLWTILRAERGPGLILLAAGALAFIGIVHAVIG